MAVADVNGDGNPDVLLANETTNTLGVLLGNGRGSFAPQANSPSTGAGSRPRSVAVADVNGDGRPDALTANYGPGTLSVLLGNGSGGFTLQPNSPVVSPGASLVSVATADVNGDGKPDALVVDEGASTLNVLLGNGSAGFALQTPAPSTGGSTSSGLAIADINGDGKPDALVGNGLMNTLGVLLGNGRGGFTRQANAPATGRTPLSVVVADVNGDGKPDALVPSYDGDVLGVLLGNGSGGFALQPNSPATGGSRPYGLAVADVNGDGKPDVLVANQYSSTLGVLLNTTAVLATHAPLPGASATLYPNPARDNVALAVTGLPATVVQVRATLLDVTGRVVGQQVLAAGQGQAHATLPTAGLAAGLYMVRLLAHGAQSGLLGELPAQRLSVW